METQLKEEFEEDNLCFETSSDTLPSLSIIEKYDRFLQRENSDVDSDADDFFPDDTMLRREYAQLRKETGNYRRITSHRLSTGLPAKYINNLDSTTVSVTDDDTPNGSVDGSREAGDSAKTGTGLIELGRLLQKLEEVRKCDPEEADSFFCSESELHDIQERYAAILDFIYGLGPTFEKLSNCKDSDSQHLDEGRSNGENNRTILSQSEDIQMLAKKMKSVANARDRFFEVEQQVREQLEQLEMVERCKMESVG